MNEELRNKLIAALQAKGLGVGIADFIVIADESEIEGVVAKAAESLPAQALTKEQMIANKEVQAEIDRRVTSALQKQGKKTTDAPEPPTDDMPAWAKTLIEQNTALTEKVTAIETGKITESKLSQAQALFAKSAVISDTFKSKWASRIDVNSETPIEDQIKSLETEFSELTQEIANNTQLSGTPPRTVVAGKPTEAEVEDIASRLMK